MKNLILNGGGGGDPDGIAAIEQLFAKCRRVAYLGFAHVGSPEESVDRMRKFMPSVPWTPLQSADPIATLRSCDGIWVMGGNSFVLADQLHALQLLDPVRDMVEGGVPYGGSSAGANIAGPSICTTNDMPILLNQRSLAGFGLVPFQINPHYLDGQKLRDSGYRGETRAERIQEFLKINDVTVIALHEATWLTVVGDSLTLRGKQPCLVFERNAPPRVVLPGTDISDLLLKQPRFNVPTFKGVSL